MVYQLVLNENGKGKTVIDVVDESKQFYAWLFYTESYKGLNKRSLNPEATLLQNKIREGNIIIAKRVKLPKILGPAQASS